MATLAELLPPPDADTVRRLLAILAPPADSTAPAAQEQQPAA